MEETPKSAIDQLFSSNNGPSKFASIILQAHTEKKSEPAPDILHPSKEEIKNPPIKKLTPEEEAEKIKRTLFIGSLPITATKMTIKKLFSPSSLVESVRFRNVELKVDRKVTKKIAVLKKEYEEDGTQDAYVVLKTEEAVNEAIPRIDGSTIEGNIVRANHALLPGQKQKTTKEINQKSIFIGHLPYDTTENELHKIFDVCGEIDYVKIPKDRVTGHPRGVAYITFKNEDSVKLALKFNEAEISKGKTITVEKSNPQKAEKMAKKKQEILAAKKAGGKSKTIPRAMRKKGKETSKASFEGFHAQKADEKNTMIKKYLKLKKSMSKRKASASKGK